MSQPQGTWLDFIERVLENAGGEALHEREIASRVIEFGYPTSGRTPARTVNRVLNEHPDLFESVGYGRYRRRSEESPHLSARRPPMVQDASDFLSELAGKRLVGQGLQMSADERREVEHYAMARAIMHFETFGWQVENVSSFQPFDLRCTRSNSEELRVEVKGTTGDGSEVILTPNEVEHARAHFPQVALFVVSGIEVSDELGGQPRATGGNETVYQPWDVDVGVLTPTRYAYRPPAKREEGRIFPTLLQGTGAND